MTPMASSSSVRPSRCSALPRPCVIARNRHGEPPLEPRKAYEMTSAMPNRFGTLLLAGVLTAFTATATHAIDIDDMQKAIAAYKSSHLCPPSGEVAPLKKSIYCKRWCDQSPECKGVPVENDPCAKGGSDACSAFSQGIGHCVGEMNEKNLVIGE
jgi:hypothetical protein